MTSKLPSRYIRIPEEPFLKGGMGEVIICRDSNLDRRVAIKFIQNVSDQSRLFDEIAALQKIRSKHVVQIYDAFLSESDRRVGIVQEYVPGDDLNTFVQQNSLSENDYLKILYQISSGLCDIHSQNLIHRDIKPNNMKFDQSNIIKIFDFGLARFAGKNDSTLGFKGTKGFAAPELYTSGIVPFTQAVDTYAFGILAWYLSGTPLPKDLLKSPPNFINIPSFSSLSLNLPDPIATILDRALDKNLLNRPTMREINNLISNYLLFGKHRGLLIHDNKQYLLEKVNKIVKLDVPNYGSIHIKYDGLNFVIDNVEGAVFINNNSALSGQVLPKDCVITLGERNASSRLFITFDVSNPEVVL